MEKFTDEGENAMSLEYAKHLLGVMKKLKTPLMYVNGFDWIYYNNLKESVRLLKQEAISKMELIDGNNRTSR